MGKLPARSKPRLFLREWMLATGRRNKDLMEAAKVSASYISNLVRNHKVNPSADVLRLIAACIGCRSDDLYNPPPPSQALATLKGISPEALATLTKPDPKK